MIVWTEQAIQHLGQSYEYIALSNGETAAARDADRILANVQRLARFSLSGRRGRVEGTRELVVGGTPFIVAYTADEDRITILAGYHSARQWPEGF